MSVLLVSSPRLLGAVVLERGGASDRSAASAIARALRAHVTIGTHLVGFGALAPRLVVRDMGGRQVARLYGIARTHAQRVVQAIANVTRLSLQLGGAAKSTRGRPKARRARRSAPAKRSRTRVRRGRATRNPSSSELAQADRMFRTWHQFGPGKVTRRSVDPTPGALVKLGEVPRITYMSDKWDGKLRTYVHDTSKPYPVLYTSPKGDRFYLLGGRMRATERGLEH